MQGVLVVMLSFNVPDPTLSSTMYRPAPAALHCTVDSFNYCIRHRVCTAAGQKGQDASRIYVPAVPAGFAPDAAGRSAGATSTSAASIPGRGVWEDSPEREIAPKPVAKKAEAGPRKIDQLLENIKR